MAQGVGPEFKPQYHKKEKKRKEKETMGAEYQWLTPVIQILRRIAV
jgi:hypothetical protein